MTSIGLIVLFKFVRENVNIALFTRPQLLW